MENYVKTKADFFKDLQEFFHLITIDCEMYDKGIEYVAPSMAAKLRVLLKDKGKNNISLLSHLDLKDIEFLNTASEIDNRNILPSEPLIYMGPDENFELMKAYPMLDKAVCVKKSNSWIDFDSWWNQVIYKNGDFTLNRQELIEHLADKDGGAHFDEKISKGYHNFSRLGGGSTTTYRVMSDENGSPGKIIRESQPKHIDNIHYASLRQITYEVLETLKRI